MHIKESMDGCVLIWTSDESIVPIISPFFFYINFNRLSLAEVYALAANFFLKFRLIIIYSLIILFLQEWGDPRTEEFYYYIKSYSPVDNVRTI